MGGGMGKLSDFFQALKFLGGNVFLAKVLEYPGNGQQSNDG